LLDQYRSIAHNVRQIEEYAARAGMAAKDSGEMITGRAAYIDDRLELGKVIGSSHGGRFRPVMPTMFALNNDASWCIFCG
jgi:hypothetical protein